MEYSFSKAAKAALLKLYSFTDAYLIIWVMIGRTALLKNTSGDLLPFNQPYKQDGPLQFYIFSFFYSFCKALVIKQANIVNTILGFTSIKSSGKPYVRAPILRLIEIAYWAFNSLS